MYYAKEHGRNNPYHEGCGGPLIVDRIGRERRTLDAIISASGAIAVRAFYRDYYGGCLTCRKEGRFQVRKPYKIAKARTHW